MKYMAGHPLLNESVDMDTCVSASTKIAKTNAARAEYFLRCSLVDMIIFADVASVVIMVSGQASLWCKDSLASKTTILS